jgi:hypothetical protein
MRPGQYGPPPCVGGYGTRKNLQKTRFFDLFCVDSKWRRGGREGEEFIQTNISIKVQGVESNYDKLVYIVV